MGRMRYNARVDGKAVGALAVGALVVAAAIGGGIKRHHENAMPINHPMEVCEYKLNTANTIQMREVPFCWGKRYNLVVGEDRVGTIYEKVFNWGKRFDFYAGTQENGRYLGHAQEKILSIGHQSTVYDELGNSVGRLDEVVLSMNPGYLIEVFDSRDNKVAISDERALAMVHQADLFDGSGSRSIGFTEKSWFWDDYTLTVNNDNIDRRLIMALVAMQDKLDDEASSDSDDD